MGDETVKVAVRVRPYLQREIDLQAKVIIAMNNRTTTIANPDNVKDIKTFNFDYSYWSHDGFTTSEDGINIPTAGSSYASQQKVFDDLGRGVLNNAMEGYNCSLFAYGQTGSGKSYSMVGYGANRGIVPITCDELFKIIEGNKDPNKTFQVTFSMLEIYNEQVRDLLSKETVKGGLPVRQNPTAGSFFVQGLKTVPVASYKEIENRMEQGTSNRTIGATNMNATSSRAHTIVSITFDQITKTDSGLTKKASVINLVDLAGSERADATGATGDRLKEGCNINKSLSVLGNVISALADLSTGKKKGIVVPYRDSVLTMLLKHALGGNSKTVMIAALSPADVNYDETLSTLRYADRAKQIKNRATVNENAMDKLLRELREENERLRKMLSGGGTLESTAGMSPEQIAAMKRELEAELKSRLSANAQLLEQASGGTANWQQRLRVAQEELDKEDGGKKMEADKKKSIPYLCNLNEDPLLSGIIVHFIEKDKTTVGKKSDNEALPTPDLILNGMSILDEHAVIYSSKGGSKIELQPGQYAKILLNGKAMTERQKLRHKDRILFGSNHLYVFLNPIKPKEPKGEAGKIAEITWDFCQKEIAKVKGYLSSGKQLSKEQQRVQEELLELLPSIGEVNTMAEEMGKRYTYELVLLSNGIVSGRWDAKGQKVMVNVRDTRLGNSWVWDRATFVNRKFLMQDMYQKYLEGENIDKIDREQDPFWEPPQDCLMGTTTVYLKSLAYNMEFSDKLVVVDLKGLDEGYVEATLIPCGKEGRPLPEENFVDEPSELIGKPYNFRLTINRATFVNAKYEKRQFKVKYRSAFDTKVFETPPAGGNSLTVEFKHSQVFRFEKADQDLIEYLDKGFIIFTFYMVPNTDESAAGGVGPRDDEGTAVALAAARDEEDGHAVALYKQEIALLKRKLYRHQEKERRIKNLVDEWESRGRGDKSGYEGFYKTVRAVIYDAADRLAARVMKLNALMRATGKRVDSDTDDDGSESEEEPPPVPTKGGILKHANNQPASHPSTARKRGKETVAMADELKVLVGDKKSSVACNVQ